MKEFGGPEVLELVELAVPEPGPEEVLIRVSRAGMNFADVHTRTNSYVQKATLPLVPGREVAGVREDTGERVIALLPSGAYAEYAVAPADLVVPLPEGLDDGAALALMVQGLTAWHLYSTAGRVARGESVVVHAAAGGVGSLAVQLGRALGAGRVIAVASSEDKRALALELGADVAIDSDPAEGLTERLLEANGGAEVDVVFEMAGGEVFDALIPRARALRTHRRLRDRLAGAEHGAHGLAAAPLALGGGLLPVSLSRAGAADVGAAAGRAVRAGGARGSSVRSSATPTLWPRPPRPRSTCASGGAWASYCSIQPETDEQRGPTRPACGRPRHPLGQASCYSIQRLDSRYRVSCCP